MTQTARTQVLMSVLLSLLAPLLGGCAAQETSEPIFLPDLSGRRVDPLAPTSVDATVLLFSRTDCPISNRYAPEVKRLYEKFAPRKVAFWLVFPTPDESVATIRRYVAEYEYVGGVLRDPHLAMVKRTGATVTPEAAVFVPGGKMVYRGRIDDRNVDFGKSRTVPTRRDLEEALEAILEGRPVAAATASAVGCFIQ